MKARPPSNFLGVDVSAASAPASETASGPCGVPQPWSDALPQCGSVLGLPIVFAGQTRGVVLLGFDLDRPSPVDLELLTTVVAQAAGACERSQLQRLAGAAEHALGQHDTGPLGGGVVNWRRPNVEATHELVYGNPI